jgi:glycosyltransferase involved in cell wall biosynthesis
MTRVLHVHEQEIDLQTRASLRALGACAADTRTIGRGGDFVNLPWAVLGLRRLVDRFDVCHAWDTRSFDAASLARAKRIVFTPAPDVSRGRMFKGTNVDVVCASPVQARVWRQGQVIRPPLPPVAASNRDAIRRQLSLRDDDFVMLAPGESTRAAAHERAVWAGSILHVVDERYRVLLWGRGQRFDTAAALGKRLRQDGLVVAARHVEFDMLLPAADALLVTATGPIPPLPVAMAMAAGVPVVAARRPELDDLLTDNVTALTVPTCTPRMLAQRILDLRTDPALAGSITEAARVRVAELFPAGRFAREHQMLYAGLLAGRPNRHDSHQFGPTL